MKRYLGLLLFCVLHHVGFSQVPHYRHFTTANGLPSNKVYCSFQDSRGFIWLGTDNGLVRYNGSEFKVFTADNGLPDNEVFSIGEDQMGKLWIICFKQAPCYFYKNKLYTVKNDTFLAKYFNNPNLFRFNNLPSEKRVIFYVALNDRIAAIENMKIKMLPWKVSKRSPVFNGVGHFQLNGNSFYSMVDEVYCENKKITYKIPDFFNIQPIQTYNNRFLVSMEFKENSIIVFEYVNDSFRILKKLLTGNVLKYCFDNVNKPFVIDENYILHDFNTGDFSFSSSTKLNLFGKISTVYLDRQGNKWICTHNNGFYVIPDNTIQILESGVDKGANCIGYRVTQKGTQIAFGFENKSVYTYNGGNCTGRIDFPLIITSESRITGLIFSNNKLYIGGDFLLERRDMTSGDIKIFRNIGATHSQRNIKDIEPLDANTFLIAGANGAACFSSKEERATEVIWANRTYAINRDQLGNDYLGTINGLYIRKSGNRKVEKWITKTSLDDSRITDIKIDLNGRIWVSTSQNGIFIIKGSRIVNISASKGNSGHLSSNQTKNIFFDSHNWAWVSTFKGLNKIKMLDENLNYRIQKINFPFEFPEENINACAVFEDTVYVATLSGIFRFSANAMIASEQPKIVITKLINGGKETDFDEDLKLRFENNSITIEFSPIMFTKSENIEYEFRLVGDNVDWGRTKNNRIDFVNIRPGQYRFEVRAINLLTGEKSELAHLEFTILAPWFKSIWFFGLLFTLILIGVTGFLYYRIEHVKRTAENRNQLSKQVKELEIQALRAHMNPHFIFNALTAIQNYFSNNDEVSANEYMYKFSILIRQMLDYSRDNFIPLDEEISLIENYMGLEVMRFESTLTFKLSLGEDIEPANYQLPSLMLQPLLENAVNHGIRTLKTKGIITLNIQKATEGIAITIEDNGRGINYSNRLKQNTRTHHKSAGLDMLVKRIESINQLYNSNIEMQIQDLSESDFKLSGTRVTMVFPWNIVSPSIIKNYD